MKRITTSIMALLMIAGIPAWAAAQQPPTKEQSAAAGTIINDAFTGDKGAAISGRTPDTANAPGGKWSVVSFNIGGGFTPTIETGAGNPVPRANLTCYGNSAGAIAISIASQGSYAKPQRFTVSADLGGANPGLGFYSALPAQDPEGVFDVFSNFTGLQLSGDGTLALYRKGGLVTRVKYTGTFDAKDFHRLSYDADTRDGTISNVNLQGSASDYSAFGIAGLKEEGIQATAIPAGHSGDTSGNMVGRTNPDVLHQGANWMTISCGVNDVASERFGCDLESFKKNVAGMVAKAQGWNVRVVLLTATPIGEDINNTSNQKLAAYNDFLRSFAGEKKLLLADVNAAFWEVLNSKLPPDAPAVPGKRLLADGIHPNDAGQFLMATTILRTLGVPKSDMPRIEKALKNGRK